jgi:hypothetical protein
VKYDRRNLGLWIKKLIISEIQFLVISLNKFLYNISMKKANHRGLYFTLILTIAFVVITVGVLAFSKSGAPPQNNASIEPSDCPATNVPSNISVLAQKVEQTPEFVQATNGSKYSLVGWTIENKTTTWGGYLDGSTIANYHNTTSRIYLSLEFFSYSAPCQLGAPSVKRIITASIPFENGQYNVSAATITRTLPP